MGMTFQAFRGSSGAQIAFTILLATSIGDRVQLGLLKPGVQAPIAGVGSGTLIGVTIAVGLSGHRGSGDPGKQFGEHHGFNEPGVQTNGFMAGG